jgi:threonine synthase
MSNNILLECIDCHHQFSYAPLVSVCPKCGGQWREAHYDYSQARQIWQEKLNARPFNLWRYRELLPVCSPNAILSLGEGGTPLVHAANIGMMLGLPHIYMKDERRGPTGSFKDRQASVTISALKEAGITEMVAASTGNVAIAYSAYAARAGIKLWVFMTSLVPAAKMREVALYGTQVLKITGSYDQAKQIASEFAKQRGLYLDSGARSIPNIESMKTLAFEISEQLPSLVGAGTTPWRAPDWYIQSVSGGMGPLGVLKGFTELYQMGLTQQIPKIACIQADGCAPMSTAWKQGQETAIPVKSPRTAIATLATGDPGRTYTLLRQRMLSAGGGVMENVSDDEAFRAMHYLAKMEGFSVEPAAAVALAGLVKMVRAGLVKPTDIIAVNCTGHTIPIEAEVLGDGWSRNLVVPEKIQETAQEEGLLAALSKISTDRYPRILIVDDTAEVRQLIRRILQSQGNYSLAEATNGREALEMVEKQRPDLIILDLMMPEMDGFTVMDALQSQANTADIPVIIATAKELTSAEKNRLKGRIQALMQKGDFLSDELLEEVRALLK